MECNASSVIRVCVTSRWVRCGILGSRVVYTDLSRMAHSWRLSLVIVSAAGSGEFLMTQCIEFLNFSLEQAQKSIALSFFISQNSISITLASSSSSMCSWARNSLRFGAKLRNVRIVSGIR